MDRMQHSFDRILGRGLVWPAGFANAPGGERWSPAVDVYETDTGIVIKAELPGVDKKDISVDLEAGVLTLKGRRVHETDVKEGDFHRRERAVGSFSRSFGLPPELKAERIKATYRDGVLTVEIPKPEEAKPKQISVH
jgi:HSP20 family protein